MPFIVIMLTRMSGPGKILGSRSRGLETDATTPSNGHELSEVFSRVVMYSCL